MTDEEKAASVLEASKTDADEGYQCEEQDCDMQCPVDADEDALYTIYYGGHQMHFCKKHYETSLRKVVEKCAGLSDDTLVHDDRPDVGDVGCWRGMLADHLKSVCDD